MQRSQGIGILRQQGGEQAAPVHLQLEQLVHIQRGGVAHHIAHKAPAQRMAAQLGQRRQVSGLHIKVGAPCIGVDGFEGVGDSLICSTRLAALASHTSWANEAITSSRWGSSGLSLSSLVCSRSCKKALMAAR
jgi:hypothetical protein